MDRSAISEDFAKELLRAMYKLDDPIGRLDSMLSSMPAGESKKHFMTALADVMDIVLSELMVPIYRAHPGLGRASEPGPWLHDS